MARRQSYHSQTSSGSLAKASGVASSSGRKLRQSPPGPLNVGTPDSAEIPAPVKATMDFAALIQLRALFSSSTLQDNVASVCTKMVIMRHGIALLFVSGALFAATDWTRYRGPNGTGLSDATGLPGEISKDKNVVWKATLPKGNSSPIVVGDKVIVTAHEGDQRLVIALSVASGKELWRTGTPKLRDEVAHPLNGPTTPSPVSDGKSLFVFFPEVGLIAYTLTGKEVWRVPLGPFSSIQGMATSPIVANGKVVLVVDQPDESWVAAYDVKSGKEKWKTSRKIGFMGGYSTPTVYKPAKGPLQLIVAGGSELTGYQVDTGEKIWWASGLLGGPAALPLVEGDTVYMLEPADQGAPPYKSLLNYDANKDGKIALDELKANTPDAKIWYRIFRSIDTNLGDKDGSVTEQEWDKSWASGANTGGLISVKLGGTGELPKDAVRWRVTKGIPYVTSALAYQDALHVVRDGGILTTYNPANGEVYKQARLKDAPGEYYASPVAGDGKIYFVSKDGKASVVKAGAQWEMLSSGDLEEQVMATPAMVGNRILVRTSKTLFCFGAATAR